MFSCNNSEILNLSDKKATIEKRTSTTTTNHSSYSDCFMALYFLYIESVGSIVWLSLALWQVGSQGFFRAGKQQWQEGTSHEHHEWGIKLHRWLRLQHLSWQPNYHHHYRHHHFHFIYTGESPSRQSLNLKLSSAEQSHPRSWFIITLQLSSIISRQRLT